MPSQLYRRPLASPIFFLLLCSAQLSFAANVAYLKPIINSSGSYAGLNGFEPTNAVDGQSVNNKVLGTSADDVFSTGGVNSSSYWLTQELAGNNPATSYFILDLGQAQKITQFRLAPSRNWDHGDRTTTTFNILASNTIDGGNNLVAPVSLVAGGTLTQPGAATGIPFAVFNPGGPDFGSYRYVQFEGTAAVNGNGALNEIQIINDFNPTINVSAFTGGDVGEGLNLDGYFLYARHAEGSGVHVVRDARFISAGPSGQLVTHNAQTGFGAPNYAAATANDTALAQAMNFVKYSDSGLNQISIDLPGLTVGKQYELQLMFNENNGVNPHRVFDVFIEGGIVLDSFDTSTASSTNGNDGIDTVIRTTFTARDSTLNVRFDSNAISPAFDRNPMIDAFTLKEVGYAPTVTVGQLTGGDLGEGLDLEGTFLYARHSATTGSHTVRGVEFTPAGPNGVLVTHNSETPFGSPNYGATADDNALEQVMDYVKFDTSQLVQLTLPGLIIGREYKLQMLFNEACCNRQFDIFHDNHLLVSQFNPGTVAGSVDNGSGTANGVDAMVTYQFIANDTVLRILLNAANTPLSGFDRNPMIDAFTLELIPEPATSTLALLAFASLLRFRRRD